MIDAPRRGTLNVRLPTGVWLALAAAGVTAVGFLAPPSIFEGQDWVQLHLPYRLYAAGALSAGRLPLWNPYVALGRPFLADLETAVLYPPNVFFLLFEPTLALALLTTVHVALALLGTLLLTRSLGATTEAGLAAGLAYTLAAPVAARLSAGQVGYFEGSCYVPLLFLLAARLQDRPSRKGLAALAVGLALQLLCGHPQIAWITWMGLGAFVLGRGASRSLRPLLTGLGGLGLALAGALALAAPALLPFLELVGQSNRSAPTLRFAGGGSMEWWQWTSLLLPDGGRRVFYWEFNLYVGVLAAIAGLAGLLLVRDRGVHGLGAAGLLGTLIAAGPRTPVFGLLFALVPGLAGFRIHSRAAILPCLALVAAAAVLLSRPARRTITVVLLLSALTVCLVVLSPVPRLPPGGARPPAVQGLVVVLAAAVAAAAVSSRPALSRAAHRLLPLVVAADLLTAHQAAKTAWAAPPPGFLEAERRLAAALSNARLLSSPAPPRVLVPPFVARENAAMAYKWASVGPYGALTLDRVWTYLYDRLHLPPPVDQNTYLEQEVYDRGPFPYPEAAVEVGWDPRAEGVVMRRDPDPRAYLVRELRRTSGWREAIGQMSRGHDVHAAALVERDGLLPGTPPPPVGGVARVEIVAFEPERVLVRAESDRPALLVLKEAWYPGWRAEVDGRPQPCVAANGWMRAVPIGAGAHEVVFSYRSRWLRGGMALGVATVLCLIAAITRKRHSRDPRDVVSAARFGRAVAACYLSPRPDE
jgi:hypothetical protein